MPRFRNVCCVLISLVTLAGCPSKETQQSEPCVGVGCPCTSDAECSDGFSCSAASICIPVASPADADEDDDTEVGPGPEDGSAVPDSGSGAELDAVSELAEELGLTCEGLCEARVACGSTFAAAFENDCAALCTAFRTVYDDVIAAAPVPADCASALEAGGECAGRLEGCDALLASEDPNNPANPCFEVDQASIRACGQGSEGSGSEGSGSEGSGSEGSGAEGSGAEGSGA